MNDKEKLTLFTKGVMDRIRDHMAEKFPEEQKEINSIDEEITGRVLKNGERGIYIRKIKNNAKKS